MNKVPLIIFHANCADGMCAAWVARMKYPDAEFRPWSYAQPVPTPELYADREVLVLDFSFPRAVLEEMAKSCALTVLDHHKTAASDLAGLSYCTFDMERSGAGMAWDILIGGTRPLIVSYIEDRDLWRNVLPNSAQVVAALHELPQGDADFCVGYFDGWDVMAELPVEQAAKQGAAHLLTTQRLARGMARTAQYAQIGEARGWVACASSLFSEVCDLLARKLLPDGAMPAFSATFHELSDGRTSYSLRSRGDFDVSALAKQYGGGGHAAAAGFTTNAPVHVRLVRLA